MNEIIKKLEELIQKAEENNTIENRIALNRFWNEHAEEIRIHFSVKAFELQDRVLKIWDHKKDNKDEIEKTNDQNVQNVDSTKAAELEDKSQEIENHKKAAPKKKNWKKILPGVGLVGLTVLGGCTGKMILDKSAPVPQEVTLETTTEEEVKPVFIKQDEEVVKAAVKLLNEIRPYTADIDGAMFYDTLLVINQDDVLLDKDFMAGKNYGNAKEKEMLLNLFHTFQHIANAQTLMAKEGETLVYFPILFNDEDDKLVHNVQKLTYDIVNIVHKEEKTENDKKVLEMSKQELNEVFEDLMFDQTTYSNYVKLFASDLALTAHADVVGHGEAIFEEEVYNSLFDKVRSCGEAIQSGEVNSDEQTLREKTYFSMDAKALADRLYQTANGKVEGVLTREELIEQINQALVEVKTPTEYMKEHSENKDLPYLGSLDSGYNLSGVSASGTTVGVTNGVPSAKPQSTGTSTATTETPATPNYSDSNNGQVISESTENLNGYDSSTGTVVIENPNTGAQTQVPIKEGTLTDQIDPSKQWSADDYKPLPTPGTEVDSYETDVNGNKVDPNNTTTAPAPTAALSNLDKNDLIFLSNMLNALNNGVTSEVINDNALKLTITL